MRKKYFILEMKMICFDLLKFSIEIVMFSLKTYIYYILTVTQNT